MSTVAPIDRPLASRRAGSPRARALAAVALVLAVLWQTGGLDWLAGSAVRLFELSVAAHLGLYEARQHVNAAGEAEYAVMRTAGVSAGELESALGARPDARYLRESAVPGWSVVAFSGDPQAGVGYLETLGLVRLSMPNRGLWLCH